MFICRSDGSGYDDDDDEDGNALQLVLAISNADQKNLMIGKYGDNANAIEVGESYS